MNRTLNKILLAVLSACFAVSLSLAATACSHEHDFSGKYGKDENGHWQYCSEDGCDEHGETKPHNFDEGTKNNDTGKTVYVCETCGYSYETANTTYSIGLYSQGGGGVYGVKYTLYDDEDNEIAVELSNSDGTIRFRNIEPGDYIAEIDVSTIPAGYNLAVGETGLVTFSRQVGTAVVKFETQLIDSETIPNKVFKVGDPMYDITITATDTTTREHYSIKLSDVLDGYKAIVLNFFYQNCSPCATEFPYIQEVYVTDKYNEHLKLIALNYTGNGETENGMISYATSKGLDFDFAMDTDSIVSHFPDGENLAFPTTVIIDRYGAIAMIDHGGIPDATIWRSTFAYYVSDDYVPEYGNGGNIGDGGSDNPTSPVVRPDMPESEDIANAITTANDLTTKQSITYTSVSDTTSNDYIYNFPWQIGNEPIVIGGTEIPTDGSYIMTSNTGRPGAFSIILMHVQLNKGEALKFEHLTSTEYNVPNDNGDYLYVLVDGVIQRTFVGEHTAWEDATAFVAQYSGNYEITFIYQKDIAVDAGNDTVYIKNVRKELAVVDGAANTEMYDGLYNAANNYTLDSGVNINDYGMFKGYYNYVATYYDETNEVYRVALSGNENQKSDNDPILLADLYYLTPWSDTFSIWNLAFAHTTNSVFDTKYEGFNPNFAIALEEYSWIQMNNPSGYVPVTKELQGILEYILDQIGRENDARQWLEVCRYYVHIGADHASNENCLAHDNLATCVGPRMAKEVGSVNNETPLEFTASVPYSLMPRGFYYKFKVETEGVYRFTANGGSFYLADSCGIAIEQGDSTVYGGSGGIVAYLKAGAWYCLGCTFGSNAETGDAILGSFKVNIAYVDATYTYLTTLATDYTYTYDEETGSVYVPTAIGLYGYVLHTDGFYYVADKNGNADIRQPIYIDLVGNTFASSYNSMTIEEMNNQGGLTSDLVVQLKIEDLIAASKEVGMENELYGFTQASDWLCELINVAINAGDTDTYAANAWMLTAYYRRVVDEFKTTGELVYGNYHMTGNYNENDLANPEFGYIPGWRYEPEEE